MLCLSGDRDGAVGPYKVLNELAPGDLSKTFFTIERSREMGKVLRTGLLDLAERHPRLGDIRGTGLHQVIELVKSRKTCEPMRAVATSLRAQGLSTFVR